MKILMLNYEFSPLGGGTGIANLYLLKELSKFKNLKIDLVTSSTDRYKEERISKNIKVYYLDIGKKNKDLHHQKSWNLINYFIKSTWYVCLKRNDYDLIHAFSGMPGGITSLISGKPYIVSLRGTEVPGYEDRYTQLNKLMMPLTKLVWKKAKFVDANSQYLKKLALKTCPDLRIKVIPNGVDTKSFYPSKKIVNKPVILCNARLGERKGVKYLIKAMAKVTKEIPEAGLMIVGEGVEEESLKRLTNKLKLDKQIGFLGQVEHKKLPGIYRKALIFVLPSLSESLSNSLLEAIASGLPVVATRTGGNSELVTKENGLLIQPANSKELAKAIIRLLNNPKLRKKMSEESLKKAKKYSWENTAKGYLKLFTKIT